jgi:hypothetical protein
MVQIANKEPPSNNSFDGLQQIPEDVDKPQIPPQETAIHINTKVNQQVPWSWSRSIPLPLPKPRMEKLPTSK